MAIFAEVTENEGIIERQALAAVAGERAE